MIEDVNLRVAPAIAASEASIAKEVARELDMQVDAINALRVVRRSIDARKRQVVVNLLVRVAHGDDHTVEPLLKPVEFPPVASNAPRLAIVGAGPAGLFAALEAIRLCIRPIVIERGADVDRRRVNIAAISREGKINPRSNYCFGEGGAGAYSDGKLFTRSKKRGNIADVLQIFVQHGASPDILVDAHPHIGSDRLPHVIKQMRQTIIDCGGEVRFDSLVSSLMTADGRVTGVKLADGSNVEAEGVVLATGHSAHDTLRSLHKEGVALEAKGIAVGVRLEHPQQLIDTLQYHSPKGRGKYLPAAEYSYITQADGRGVYSFCMCPGGVVVPAGSADGELVVNGMSASARAGRWANSGMVVEIRPGDFPEFASEGPLELLALQKSLEEKFFEESGGINAPAQRMKDFTDGVVSKTLPATSYAPGIHPADFNRLFPPFISWRLRKGFVDFGKKCPGFLTNDATMIGLESRTSSPVRILRDSETLESPTFRHLYPAGEGAGYAGGIVSAAVDGIRCARAFSESITNKK